MAPRRAAWKADDRVNDCPPIETLREMIEGRSPEERTRVIVDHIAICSECRLRADELSDDARLRELYSRSTRLVVETPDSLGELKIKLYSLGDEAPRRLDRREWEAASDGEPKILGRYQLHEVLGSGGFGVVYRADDIQLRRPVALKLPRPEALADADGRRRFLREARVAAGLHHPHIVALYDAGEVDGVWYLASALTPGPTLAQWAAKQKTPPPIEQALGIAMALAQAVQHAHEHGVLHRDIKPQNVLLDPTIDFRGLGFSPQLTDFGVAKLLSGDVEQTIAGQLFGTPRYMAPELATGKPEAAQPASDIYALGVVLYELLSGQAPIDGESQVDVLRRSLTEEPKRLRKLRPEVSRDVEAVCLTCLEKEPGKRYASAGELAADLERCLERQPTIARPISAWERASRWTKRRPATASLIGVCLTAVALAVVGLVVHSQRVDDKNRELVKALDQAQTARAKAALSDEETRQLLYVTDMRLAAQAYRAGDLRTLHDLLARQRPRAGEKDRRGLEWRYLKQFDSDRSRMLVQAPGDVYFLAMHPQGRIVAAAGKDGAIRFFDLVSGRLEQSIASGQGEVNGLAFSRDGERLASTGDDGALRVWRWGDAAPLLSIPAHESRAYQVAFCENDASLLTCGDDAIVHKWSSADGSPLGEFSGNEDNVEALAIARQGDVFATAGKDGSARLWSLATGGEIHAWRAASVSAGNYCIAFSPAGDLLAVGGGDGGVWLLSRASGAPIATGQHLDGVYSLAFSPDGRRLVSGDAEGSISVWDWSETISFDAQKRDEQPPLRLLRKWQAHAATVFAVCFAANEQLLSGGADGAVRIWQLPKAMVDAADSTYRVGIGGLAFTRADTFVAPQRAKSCISGSLADTHDLDALKETACDWSLLASDAQGRRHATLTDDGRLELWETPAGDSVSGLVAPGVSELGRQRATIELGAEIDCRRLRLSADGKLAALSTTAPRREILLFEANSGRPLGALPMPAGAIGEFALSPDGRRVAAKADNAALLWRLPRVEEAKNGPLIPEKAERIAKISRSLICLAFSPDGSLLAAGGGDRNIQFWNPDTGEELATLSGHRGAVRSLIFTRDGKTLLSGGDDGCVKVWHVATRHELFDLLSDRFDTQTLQLSPDGHWLGAVRDGACRLFLLDLGAP